MYHCYHLHLIGEPPSSIVNLDVIREVCEFCVTWDEPLVSNGDITGYTIDIALLAGTGEQKISVNYTNVSHTNCSLGLFIMMTVYLYMLQDL